MYLSAVGGMRPTKQGRPSLAREPPLECRVSGYWTDIYVETGSSGGGVVWTVLDSTFRTIFLEIIIYEVDI